MTKSKAKNQYAALDEQAVMHTLKQMETDTSYNTQSRYVADSVKYPLNQITFSEKHMEHLRKFPNINPDQYISNLKLMTRTSI